MKKYQPETKDELKKLCDDLRINLRNIDTSKITDMSHLFEFSKRRDFSGIETWNVSQVTDMSYMFSNSHYQGMFCHLYLMPKMYSSLKDWDVSKVKNMAGMFYHSPFAADDFNNWDVSNVEDMSHMFEETYSNDYHSHLLIDKWDVSRVSNMNHMFCFCCFNADISNWDVSNVKDASQMFYQNRHFKQNLSSWKFADSCKTKQFNTFCMGLRSLDLLPQQVREQMLQLKTRNYLLTFEGCGSIIYNFKQEDLNHCDADYILNNIDDCSSVIDEKFQIDVLKTQIIAALKENYPNIILSSDFDLDFYAEGDELEVNAEDNIKYTGSLSISGTIPFRANSKDSVEEIENRLTYSVVNCIDDYLMNLKQKDPAFEELSLGDFAQSVEKPLSKKTDLSQDKKTIESKNKIHI